MRVPVEVEGMEAVVKPDRSPDYIAPYGSAFWWNEMVYMGATGQLTKMSFDEDTGKLHVIDHNGMRGKQLADNIRDMYNYWMYGAMEEAMLEVGNEEPTTES